MKASIISENPRARFSFGTTTFLTGVIHTVSILCGCVTACCSIDPLAGVYHRLSVQTFQVSLFSDICEGMCRNYTLCTRTDCEAEWYSEVMLPPRNRYMFFTFMLLYLLYFHILQLLMACRMERLTIVIYLRQICYLCRRLPGISCCARNCPKNFEVPCLSLRSYQF